MRQAGKAPAPEGAEEAEPKKMRIAAVTSVDTSREIPGLPSGGGEAAAPPPEGEVQQLSLIHISEPTRLALI
eukprot:14184253-Alexandrium_andersonii.AAC.1